MRPVYLQGRSLNSALGNNLQQAIAALADGGIQPQRVQLPGGTEWPCFKLAYPDQEWRQAARALICSAVADAGITAALSGDKTVPLFIASSSLDIGAIEMGEGAIGESFDFAAEIAGWLNWQGPVYLVSSACTSAMQAIQSAAKLVASGKTDDVVVLGFELPNRFSISGFAAMQLLTPNQPAPLGTGRDGIALGEAVAVLHLSSAPARWRICGGSNIVDGRDPTGAVPQSVARMCRQALSESGITPSDIDLIKLQAAGSPANDGNELSGLAETFTTMPSIVTLKTAIGHTLGASGAAEIALLTSCIESAVWPRFGYEQDGGLHYELASEMPVAPRYILANILGFGGGHAAVIFEDTAAGRGGRI